MLRRRRIPALLRRPGSRWAQGGGAGIAALTDIPDVAHVWSGDVVTESGGAVTAWPDQVGSLDIGSIVGTPAFAASIAALNAQPGITLVSADSEGLRRAAAESALSFLHQAATVYGVVRRGSTAQQNLVDTNNTSGNARGILIRAESNDRLRYIVGNNTIGIADFTTPIGTFGVGAHVFSCSVSAADGYRVRIDGVEQGAAALGGSPDSGNPTSPLSFGIRGNTNQLFFDGDFGAFVFCNAFHDAATVAAVEAFLTERYIP